LNIWKQYNSNFTSQNHVSEAEKITKMASRGTKRKPEADVGAADEERKAKKTTDAKAWSYADRVAQWLEDQKEDHQNIETFLQREKNREFDLRRRLLPEGVTHLRMLRNTAVHHDDAELYNARDAVVEFSERIELTMHLPEEVCFFDPRINKPPSLVHVRSIKFRVPSGRSIDDIAKAVWWLMDRAPLGCAIVLEIQPSFTKRIANQANQYSTQRRLELVPTADLNDYTVTSWFKGVVEERMDLVLLYKACVAGQRRPPTPSEPPAYRFGRHPLFEPRVFPIVFDFFM
jgi:hypothetical protein